MPRRAFVVVIDAAGAGPLPDSADYGDAGADTLANVAAAVGGLRLPTLQRLGLGNVRGLEGVAPAADPQALTGRLHPLGPGKDSTVGHWELMGVVTPRPLPTYPDGFPAEIMRRLQDATGHEFLCNATYSGTAVIEDFGAEHLRTGRPILYTSADSVLQIAAHSDVLDEPALYELCTRVRAQLTGADAVGRVIARPFTGPQDAFARTDGRKDLSVPPPGRSYLEVVAEAGRPVVCVGKPADLFAGVGVTARRPGATNAVALAQTAALIGGDLQEGLAFVNLIETDQVYGHRKDTGGFHAALQHIDDEVARWLEQLGDDDLLVLTADHGVDPASSHTDHTREHVPLLAVFGGCAGRVHDGPMADVGATVADWLGTGDDSLPGTTFLPRAHG